MLPANMTQLFDKLSDLKSVFIYGQRVIPIIQNLVDFMKETIPLIENINFSIADSTSKIPKASHQINNVTHATELATTEILDLVDVISTEAGKLENEFKKIAESNKVSSESINRLMELTSGNEEAQSLLKSLKEQQIDETVVSKFQTSIETIRNDSYNITLSLQVQDITSQQLAAVNHLIESVQEKLSNLIVDINEADLNEGQEKSLASDSDSSLEIEAPVNAAFNPNASYKKNGDSQILADAIVEKANNASQDEIDKLFA